MTNQGSTINNYRPITHDPFERTNKRPYEDTTLINNNNNNNNNSLKYAVQKLDIPEAATLQLEYLHCVEVESSLQDKKCWWPCLVFPISTDKTDHIVKGLETITGKSHFELRAHYSLALLNHGWDLDPGMAEATLLLGDPPKGFQRVYINLNNDNNTTLLNRESFTKGFRGFMTALARLIIPQREHISGLNDAFLQAKQIIAYHFATTNTSTQSEVEISSTATNAVAATTAVGLSTKTTTTTTTTTTTCTTDNPVVPIVEQETNSVSKDPPNKKQRRVEGNSSTHQQQHTSSRPITALRQAETENVGEEEADESHEFDRPTDKSYEEDEEDQDSSATNETTKMSNERVANIKSLSPKPASRAKAPKSTNKSPSFQKTLNYMSIPRWSKVQGVLEKCGYEFDDGLYARPFGNPKRNKEATEGVDYFKTEDAFRAFSCKEGFDYISVPPVAKDQDLANMWCRCHILGPFLEDETQKIPELEMKTSLSIRVLKKIGIKWVDLNVIKRGFKIPGTKLYIPEEEDLWEHLACFGLPEACKLDKFDEDEHLAMLQYIINWAMERKEAAFNEVTNLGVPPVEIETADNEDHTPCPAKRTVEINVSANSTTATCDNHLENAFTPGLDPEAIAGCNRAPETTSPHNARNNLESNFNKQAPIESHLRRNEAETSTTDLGAQVRVTQNAEHQIDKNTAAIESTEQLTEESAKSGIFIEMTAEKLSEVTLPGKNIDTKLQSCLNALRTDFSNELVVGDKLSDSLNKVGNFLKGIVDSRGLESGAFMHICGAPGVGKTVGVRACVEKMHQYWAKEIRQSTEKGHIEKPKVIYMKGSELQSLSKSEALKKTWGLVGKRPREMKRPPCLERSKKSVIILILDEIDMLVSKSSASKQFNGTEEYLRLLFETAGDEDVMFSLIGISNSIDNNRLNSLGFSGKKVVFQTYEKEALVQIITSKIGTSVVHQRTVAFLASKIEATSGDARTMVGLVSCAIEACREKTPKARLAAELTSPVVKLPHAMMAIKKQNPKIKDLINACPNYEKYTLCCGVHLSRALEGQDVTLGRLFQMCMEAFGNIGKLEMEDFKGILERLVDKGLLKMADDEKKSFSRAPSGNLIYFPLRFGLQLEDVVSALEEGILKEPFYQTIVRRCDALRSRMNGRS